MYRIAICDDDPVAAKENEQVVCQVMRERGMEWAENFSVECFYTAKPLLERSWREPNAFDLLLMDIQLERGNGIGVVAQLRKMGVRCSIAYVTNYPQYMPEAFETHPIHYLLKPVDPERLTRLIQWDLQEHHSLRQITLLVNREWRKIFLQDIIYIETDGHRVAIHMEDEIVHSSQPLSRLMERIKSNCFCCCHQGIVVNLDYVRSVRSTSLLLQDGKSLPISRSRQRAVKENFINYINTQGRSP